LDILKIKPSSDFQTLEVCVAPALVNYLTWIKIHIQQIPNATPGIHSPKESHQIVNVAYDQLEKSTDPTTDVPHQWVDKEGHEYRQITNELWGKKGFKILIREGFIEILTSDPQADLALSAGNSSRSKIPQTPRQAMTTRVPITKTEKRVSNTYRPG